MYNRSREMHRIQKNEPITLQLQIPQLEQHSKLVRIERCDLRWAQHIALNLHYLHRQVHDLAYPFAYAILDNASNQAVGMLMLAAPHFTRCREMFGYPGLPTKWQVLLLSRIWVEPDWQTEVAQLEDGSIQLSGPVKTDRNGKQHSLCVASCAIAQMLKRVDQDWLAHHPPRYLDQPYQIEKILSYCDPAQGHTGTLYKAANFTQFQRMTHGKQALHRHSKQVDRAATRK